MFYEHYSANGFVLQPIRLFVAPKASEYHFEILPETRAQQPISLDGGREDTNPSDGQRCENMGVCCIMLGLLNTTSSVRCLG
jgi:hypothetical protein